MASRLASSSGPSVLNQLNFWGPHHIAPLATAVVASVVGVAADTGTAVSGAETSAAAGAASSSGTKFCDEGKQ